MLTWLDRLWVCSPCHALPFLALFHCAAINWESFFGFSPLPWTPALPLKSTSAQCFWFNAYLISSSGLPLSGCFTRRFLEERAEGWGERGMGAGGVRAARGAGGHHLSAMFRCRRWKAAGIPAWIFVRCLWSCACPVLDLTLQASGGISPSLVPLCLSMALQGCRPVIPLAKASVSSLGCHGQSEMVELPATGWTNLTHFVWSGLRTMCKIVVVEQRCT